MSPKRRNQINEQFSARLISMLESPAYRALSRASRLVISRIEVELARHGGNDNGRLPARPTSSSSSGCTVVRSPPPYGKPRRLDLSASPNAGVVGTRNTEAPNKFFLTFAYGRTSRQEPPTHDWRRIESLKRPSKYYGQHALTRTPMQLRTASGAGAGGSKNKTPARKIPTNQYGKSALKR